MNDNVIVAWSGGKDSALALYEIQKAGNFEISGLLTTVTEEYDRVSMHGIRRELLEQQTRSLGYQLEHIVISKDCSHEEYESKMKAALTKYQDAGVSGVVFGDIFLADVRNYREENLARIGMKGIFPLWKRNSAELARTFTEQGFKAVITCVDSHALAGTYAGRGFDKPFISSLPPSVDPCGENGEFHSFVYDGPIFHQAVTCSTGDVVLRDNRFYYCDVLAGTTPRAKKFS